MNPRQSTKLPFVLAAAAGVVLLLGAIAGALTPHVHKVLTSDKAYATAFRMGPPEVQISVTATARPVAWIMILAGAVGLVAAAAASRPKPGGRTALTAVCCALYVQSGTWIFVTLNAIHAVVAASVPVHGEILDNQDAFKVRLLWTGPALLVGALTVGLQFLATRRRVLIAYGVIRDEPTISAAERVHRLVRARNPASQNSFDFALALHFLLIAVLPAAFVMRGCSDSFLIPGGGGGGGGGGGDGAVAKGNVTVKLVKQKKPPSRRKKQFGRSNSAISLYFPSIDESQVASDVAEVTENVYTANVNDVDIATDAGGFAGAGSGGFGHGPGSGGGFGGGSAQGIIRFIRLQYEDPQWNDGMDAESRADMNFLDELHKVSHLKTSDHSEAIPVGALRNFKKGQAPPFVYFTGVGSVINLSSEDLRIIRQYLLEGGMLIADAGSEEWGRAFRSFIVRVFPERQLLDVSNDDPIFQQPFRFPGGAPPLWHHDGSRARGMKIDGRWAVFYFPGNLNDAWKTGHGGQSPAIVTQSMRLGMNLVWYSFVHYLEATKQYRK